MYKKSWLRWCVLIALGTSAWGCGEAAYEDDDALTNEDDGTVIINQALTKGTVGAVNGDGDFCNDPLNKCVAGEGDCDTNAQCATGNFCGKDNGPQFGMPAKWDVCIPNHCQDGVLSGDESNVDCGGAFCAPCPGMNPLPLGDANYCNDPNFPCSAGEGDCDLTSQCTAGNFCGKDNGPQFGLPAGYDVCIPTYCKDGVLSGDETAIDCGGAFCKPCPNVNPLPPGHPDYCNDPNLLCQVGEGDCDSDLQCDAGLACKTGIGEAYGFSSDTDVCVVAHCANNIIDSDQGEIGVDCGGADCVSCGNLVWNRVLSGPAAEFGRSVAVDANGDVYVTGYFSGTVNFGGGNRTSAGGEDIFVAKYNGTTGTHIWSVRLGGLGDEQAFDVTVNPVNNRVYLTGFYKSATMLVGATALVNAGDKDAFLIALSATGTPQWAKSFGSTSRDTGEALAINASGELYVTGHYRGTVNFGGGALASAGELDAFLAKFDGTNGNHIWSKRLGGASDDYGNDIALNAAGQPTIIGTSRSGSLDLGGGNLPGLGNTDIILGQFNAADGAHVWSKRLGGSDIDSGDAIAFDTSGNIIIGGYFYGTAAFGGSNQVSLGFSDAFIAKLDGTGNHLFSRRYGSTGADAVENIATDSGNVYTTGYFQDTVNFGGGTVSAAGGTDVFTLKLNSSLNYVEVQRYGAGGLDFGRAIATTSSGVFWTGSFIGSMDFGAGPLSGAGADEVFLFKTLP